MNELETTALMDQHTVNLKDAGARYLSLKPRLLKCTTPSMASQEAKDIGAQRKGYLSVEFLENNEHEIRNLSLVRMDLSK